MKKITFTKELKKIWDVKVSCKALSIDFELPEWRDLGINNIKKCKLMTYGLTYSILSFVLMRSILVFDRKKVLSFAD